MEISFWPIELNCDHLSEGALARPTRVMEADLCQEAEDDAVKWESDNSSDHDYSGVHHQGAQRVNVGQLWEQGDGVV